MRAAGGISRREVKWDWAAAGQLGRGGVMYEGASQVKQYPHEHVHVVSLVCRG